VLLDKVESGCLILETQQGPVRIELSFRQRLYLLWTFRHFRHLSAKLLNSRQRALVNVLFRNNSGALASPNDQLPVIGVIDNFALPPEESRPAFALQTAQEKDQMEETTVPRLAIEQKSERRFSLAPKIDWSVLATSKIAAIVGWACLCLMFVMAWRRIQTLPSSQAHGSPSYPQAVTFTPTASVPSTTQAIKSEEAIGITPSTGVERVDARFAVKRASHAPAMRSHIPIPKRAISLTKPVTVATSKMEAVDQESAIEASRAPLHFIYPEHPNVTARSMIALIARVEADGTVQSVRVVSGNRSLAAAAARAVRQWRYSPFIKDGHAVATETNIVISFIAHDAISMSFPPSIPAIR
jgi:outer membrane biosynthesis protein TonB